MHQVRAVDPSCSNSTEHLVHEGRPVVTARGCSKSTRVLAATARGHPVQEGPVCPCTKRASEVQGCANAGIAGKVNGASCAAVGGWNRFC